MWGRRKRDGEISALENMIADKDQDLTALGKQLHNVMADRDAAAADSTRLASQVIELKARNDELTVDNQDLTQTITTMHTSMEKMVAEAQAAKKTEANLRDRLAAENLKVTKLEAENRKLSDQVSNLMVESDTAANAVVDGKHPVRKVRQ